MVDQLQWGERQRRGAVALGSRQPVDDLLLIDELETLECERRAGTIAQQALQPGAIVRAHAHRGIERESAVFQGQHFADIVRLDQPAAGEPPQHPHAYLLGDGGEGLRRQLSGGEKAPR